MYIDIGVTVVAPNGVVDDDVVGSFDVVMVVVVNSGLISLGLLVVAADVDVVVVVVVVVVDNNALFILPLLLLIVIVCVRRDKAKTGCGLGNGCERPVYNNANGEPIPITRFDNWLKHK